MRGIWDTQKESDLDEVAYNIGQELELSRCIPKSGFGICQILQNCLVFAAIKLV